VTVEKGARVWRKSKDPKRGMTLDELGAFVQEAMGEEIPGSTVVKMTATWRSSIKKLEVKVRG
jgi:hypothetical protein